jgi:hypothetical protein
MIFCSNRDAEKRHIIPFSNKLIRSDTEAWEAYPKFRYFYNKLWVAKSQNIQCNTMDIPPNLITQYPVFIKPIINLDGGNKDCYKIDSPEIFSLYAHRKDMFWSEFINKDEGSSDFVINNGKIVFEINYHIKNKKNDFIQTETILSPKNKCPTKVRAWIEKNMNYSLYNGILNVQYRGNKIIECGLRFDAGGNYIQWTMNKNIIISINYFLEKNTWKSLSNEEFFFEDRYIIECNKSYPIIYYFPYPLMKFITNITKIENYDFYIDETKNEINFFTLVDKNRDKLYYVKKWIEIAMCIVNWIFIIFFIILIFLIIIYIIFKFYNIKLKKNIKNSIIKFSIFGILIFLTRFINPPKYIRKIL